MWVQWSEAFLRPVGPVFKKIIKHRPRVLKDRIDTSTYLILPRANTNRLHTCDWFTTVLKGDQMPALKAGILRTI